MKKIGKYVICMSMVFMLGACGSDNKNATLYKDMNANETAQEAYINYFKDLTYFEAVTETKENGKITEIQTVKCIQDKDSVQAVGETQIKNAGSKYDYQGNLTYYWKENVEGGKRSYTDEYQMNTDDQNVITGYSFKTEKREEDNKNFIYAYTPLSIFSMWRDEVKERQEEGDSIVLHAEKDNGNFDAYIGKDGYLEKLVLRNNNVERYSKLGLTKTSVDYEITITFSHRNDTPDMKGLLDKADASFKAHEKEAPAAQYMSKEDTKALKDGVEVTKLPNIEALVEMGKYYDINPDGTVKLFPLEAYYLRNEITLLYDNSSTSIRDKKEKELLETVMKEKTNFQQAYDNSLPGSRIDFENGKWQ